MCTFLFNTKKIQFYLGDKKPLVYGDLEITSHLQLIIESGWKIRDCIGGSIKNDGSIEFRSKSINEENYGMIDIGHTRQASVVENLLHKFLNKLRNERHRNYDGCEDYDAYEDYYNKEMTNICNYYNYPY